MTTIIDRLGHFTGHIGPVRFRNGVAETHDPDMVAYFQDDPDRWDVETDEQPDPTDDDLAALQAELDALDDDPDED